MADINLKLDTWNCACGYNMPGTVDPYSDAFVAKYLGVERGGCPSCATHPNPLERKHAPLSKATDLERMTSTTTASDASLEAYEVEETDVFGNVVMEETGEYRQKIGIVNGQIGIINESILRPKMRSLTSQELAALKEQRDRNLDALEGIAVKEVSG